MAEKTLTIKKQAVKKYSGNQWEYLTVGVDTLAGVELNQFGLEGWELVAVVSTNHTQTQEFLYFKRLMK